MYQSAAGHLVEVIRTFSELLEINYMLETGVAGKVTIHTAGKLERDELIRQIHADSDGGRRGKARPSGRPNSGG